LRVGHKTLLFSLRNHGTIFTSFHMKKTFYACLALASLLLEVAPAQAQTVTNLNLESWATRNGVEAPANWQTTDDDFAAAFGAPSGTYNFGTVTKSTDKHGGTYAAKLTTTNFSTTNGPVPVPGELILGAKAGVYNYFGISVGGTSLASRPTQMQCYYKLTGTAAVTDSALALVYMTKTTNGVPSVIGRGYQFLAPAATYTSLTVPITYSTTSTATPDSVHVVFTSGWADNITAGTTLFVDDVTISGVNLATRADADVQAQFSVSPNPSTGGRFQLNAPEAPALSSAAFTVSDMMGRTVAQQPALAAPSPTRELDLSHLTTGIYLLRLDTKQGVVVRQLTIK
jgi:hypothetical protein